MVVIETKDGRSAFGADPANYDTARPEYPTRVYDILRERCGLALGNSVFEIGPGTGLATRRLLKAGATPLVAIEPDVRLAQLLREIAREPPLEIIRSTFEDAQLAQSAFDLGVAATSFHWMDQRSALAKVASLLRPHGWWAAWWNVFGDPNRADPFHDATTHLFQGTSSPSYPPTFKHPFALDREARLADIGAVDAFDDVGAETINWTLTLNADQTRALYATYSTVTLLPEDMQRHLLNEVHAIAANQFGNRVERAMVTAVYTARRR